VNVLARATALIIDPASEWPVIEQQSDDAAYLLSRYVAPLALIPALCGFVGACVIGVVGPRGTVARAAIFDGLFGAIFGYVATFATVLLVALFANLLATRFGGRRDFAAALRLAAYSFTPLWLVGICLLLPGLYFIMLTGLYSAYILAKGLPPMMKSPRRASPGYAAAIVVFAAVLIALAAAAQRGLFGQAAVQ